MHAPPLEEHGGPGIMLGPGAVDSAIGELLSLNVGLVGRVRDNMNRMEVGDNIDLLSRLRDNILSITENMNNTPGIMSQMPQLPLQMDVNLANAILPMRRMPSMSIKLEAPPVVRAERL
jgi:hypothetical protein